MKQLISKSYNIGGIYNEYVFITSNRILWI